jgi:hypothetical protein
VKAGKAVGVVTAVQDDFISKGVEFYYFGVAEYESGKLVLYYVRWRFPEQWDRLLDARP